MNQMILVNLKYFFYKFKYRVMINIILRVFEKKEENFLK